MGTTPPPIPDIPLPQPTDLISVEMVKRFAGVKTTTDDDMIQLLISGFSRHVLTLTGYDSLNSLVDYTEVRDGNGNTRMFLRNAPVRSVASLKVSGVTIPLSDGWMKRGYYIEDSKKSIALRGGVRFWPGDGNIEIAYNAGYDGTPFDLSECAMRVVSLNYKRRDWQDLASKSLATAGASGTTTYRDWAMSPIDERIVHSYKRQALV